MKLQRVLVVLGMVGVCAGVLGEVAPPATVPSLPEHADLAAAPDCLNAIRPDGLLTKWIVLGPFPNPNLSQPLPDGATRGGFHTDYLVRLGGETKAALQDGLEVTGPGADGMPHSLKAKAVTARDGGGVDLEAVLGGGSNTVGYAFCQIQSEREGRIWMFVGTDDSYKLYVNGQLVQSLWTPGRNANAGTEELPVSVHQGTNSVLLKVENGRGGWEFIVDALTGPRSSLILGVDHGVYYSPSMKRHIGHNVYLPPDYAAGAKRYPVIYFLHGRGSGENSSISPFVRIFDKAVRAGQAPPAILVFATGGSPFSRYTDGSDGQMSETTIIRELIPYIDANYRTIAERRGRAISGMSMGGFGALKFAFKYPEMFGAVVGYAPALSRGDENKENAPATFLKANVDKIRGRQAIRIVCGTADFLLEGCRAMRSILDELKVPNEFEEVEGLPHSQTPLANATALRNYQFILKRLAPAAGP
jgi:endo-1,4-beta-xylanase